LNTTIFSTLCLVILLAKFFVCHVLLVNCISVRDSMSKCYLHQTEISKAKINKFYFIFFSWRTITSVRLQEYCASKMKKITKMAYFRHHTNDVMCFRNKTLNITNICLKEMHVINIDYAEISRDSFMIVDLMELHKCQLKFFYHLVNLM
jgi:hypothetical protein